MIQQSLHPFRSGLMGPLPLGAEYMRGVEARARMLARACRGQPCKDSEQDSEDQDSDPDSRSCLCSIPVNG